MGSLTNIEWADKTFSPWIGCQKVGPGCDHCYAEARNARFGGGSAPNWGPGAERRRTTESYWKQALRWDRDAAETGFRPGVFPSLCDPFDNAIPDQWREDFFDLITATPNLQWLLLTKRISNVVSMTWDRWGEKLPGNIAIGATMVNQAEVDRDWSRLVALPTDRLFVSFEPMLGPIVLPENLLVRRPWILCGGESGPGARPINPLWPLAIRDQCAAAAAPFMFKQWGEWFRYGEIDARGYQNSVTCQEQPDKWHVWDEGGFSVRLGKKKAGNHLDGVQHLGFPDWLPR